MGGSNCGTRCCKFDDNDDEDDEDKVAAAVAVAAAATAADAEVVASYPGGWVLDDADEEEDTGGPGYGGGGSDVSIPCWLFDVTATEEFRWAEKPEVKWSHELLLFESCLAISTNHLTNRGGGVMKLNKTLKI